MPEITRGRDVKNGDIRVVVGVDKVSSWGIATSACNTGQTASYVFKHDPTHAYKWDCIGGSGRVGPQKSEIHDLIEDNAVPQNQCVFVRTINFTLSGKMWNDFPSEAVQQLAALPGQANLAVEIQLQAIEEDQGEDMAVREAVVHLQVISPVQCRGFALHPSVNFDPVELGVSRATLLFIDLTHNMIQVNHPSAALHNCLHEKVTNIMHSGEVYAQDVVYSFRMPTWLSLKTWTGYPF
jgi:hypothetical protein